MSIGGLFLATSAADRAADGFSQMSPGERAARVAPAARLPPPQCRGRGEGAAAPQFWLGWPMGGEMSPGESVGLRAGFRAGEVQQGRCR